MIPERTKGGKPGSLRDLLEGRTSDEATKEPLTAVGYCRVSTDDQGAASLPAQEKAIVAFADREGVDLVGTFSEKHSAFRNGSKRPVFSAMVEQAVSDPSIGAVIVADMSRFGRDSTEAKADLRRLAKAGVQVLSVSDAAFDAESESGLWIEGVTLLKNEAFSRAIGFATKRGQAETCQQRAPDGRAFHNGGDAPFGYARERILVGEDSHGPVVKTLWKLDPEVVAGKPRWEWAKQILDWRRRGMSLPAIAERLTAAGVHPPRKERWCIPTLFEMVCRPWALLRYAGVGCWGIHRRNGTARPANEWTITPSAHPAIISMTTAEGIMAVNARRRTRVGRKPKGKAKKGAG